MRMKVCILGISILFLNSSYCFDQLKGDKNDLESSSSSYSEVMSDTRINNVLLKQLLERVEHVEEENRHLLKLVHHLETENSNRKKEIDELRDEFDLQKEYTNGLEELIVEIGNSKQNVKIPEENKVDKQNTLLNYTKQSPSMTQPLTSSQGHFKSRIRRAPVDLEVAFFAARSKHQTHLGNLQSVLFDHVETNIGNGYDPNLGVIRAPVAGTYVFATTVVTFGHNSTHFGVFINTRRVTIIWVNGSDNGWDSSSQTVILSLNRGDDVTIKHTGTDKAIWGDNHCIFSGYLLIQNESVDPSIIGK